MTDIVFWPRELLRPENFQMQLVNTSVSGGRAPNGGEQVVTGAGGYWTANCDKFGIWMRSQVLAYRAILASLDGRSGLCLLPMWDRYNAPVFDYSIEVPWADGVPHVLWDVDTPWSSGTSDVFVDVGDVPLRATTMAIRWTTTAPDVGQYFAVGQSFHVITKIAIAPTNQAATISFRPPARTPFPLNSEVNMHDPRCLMRMASDDEGGLNLAPTSKATPSIKWVEANVPLPAGRVDV